MILNVYEIISGNFWQDLFITIITVGGTAIATYIITHKENEKTLKSKDKEIQDNKEMQQRITNQNFFHNIEYNLELYMYNTVKKQSMFNICQMIDDDDNKLFKHSYKYTFENDINILEKLRDEKFYYDDNIKNQINSVINYIKEFENNTLSDDITDIKCIKHSLDALLDSSYELVESFNISLDNDKRNEAYEDAFYTLYYSSRNNYKYNRIKFFLTYLDLVESNKKEYWPYHFLEHFNEWKKLDLEIKENILKFVYEFTNKNKSNRHKDYEDLFKCQYQNLRDNGHEMKLLKHYNEYFNEEYEHDSASNIGEILLYMLFHLVTYNKESKFIDIQSLCNSIKNEEGDFNYIELRDLIADEFVIYLDNAYFSSDNENYSAVNPIKPKQYILL